MRHGDWKLVASREDQNQEQLFNLAADKEELHDLSLDHPEKVAQLRALWKAWDADNIPAAWTPKPLKAGKGQGRQARRRAAASSVDVVQQ